MGLRGKTMAILLVTVAAMALAVLVAFRVFYARTSERIELREAEEDVRRVSLLLDDDLRQLDILCRDWAFWDATYFFAGGEGRDYLESTLGGSESLDNLGLSGLLFRDASGRALYSFESAPGLAAGLLEGLSAAGAARAGGSGLAAVNGEVHLVAARAILKSDLEGPSRGLLVMSRRVDEAWQRRCSKLIGRPVLVSVADRPADEEPSFAREGRSVRASLDRPDLARRSAVVLGVLSPSAAEHYGTRGFLLFSTILVVIVALAGLVMVFVLESTLLRRMSRIGEDLDRISGSGDLSIRIPATGDDELAVLCRTLNGSLDQLGSIIKEREAMLHELHHRVKNNLQVISSMLSLQSSACSEETAEELGRSRLRVQAMAIVQEEIFARPSVGRIALLPLLGKLASSVEQNRPSALKGSIGLEGDPLEVSVDLAVPIALAAGEALHDALFHAFPGRTEGTIVLAARALPEGGLSVEVRDDGIGFPEGGEPGRGLGLALIEALALQLRGSFGFSPAPGGGTVFRLEIPPEATG
ncbi:MAG TPA: CHASE4 domain-containing protein [Spirochaetia bacterium]|nr:CHASE4 domain-containing protein [Spirochaetia bacterium]